MVHALHEARRVLKPNGLLVDLRPAAVHRRVGIRHAGRYQRLGTMRERFDDDYAANRAVDQVVRQGLFEAEKPIRFEVRRIMDTLDEFRAWTDEFVSLGKFRSHDWLVQRVEQALHPEHGNTKIVVSGPLDLRVLRKRAAGSGVRLDDFKALVNEEVRK